MLFENDARTDDALDYIRNVVTPEALADEIEAAIGLAREELIEQVGDEAFDDVTGLSLNVFVDYDDEICVLATWNRDGAIGDLSHGGMLETTEGEELYLDPSKDAATARKLAATVLEPHLIGFINVVYRDRLGELEKMPAEGIDYRREKIEEEKRWAKLIKHMEAE